jgi:hypothetical protein
MGMIDAGPAAAVVAAADASRVNSGAYSNGYTCAAYNPDGGMRVIQAWRRHWGSKRHSGGWAESPPRSFRDRIRAPLVPAAGTGMADFR